MKRFLILTVGLAAFCGILPAADHPTSTANKVWVKASKHPIPAVEKRGGHWAHFHKLASIRNMRKGREFKPQNVKAVALPIDWTKGHTISFPMDLNDSLGDCYYAAICHTDNCWAGNSGQPFTFSTEAIQTRYELLSGGDNGLDDQQAQDELMSPAVAPGQGFCADGDNDPNRKLTVQKAATAVDWMSLDPTVAATTQTAMWRYGPVIVTFGIPDNWLQETGTGAVWTTPATPDQNNGHAVIWTGCDAQGRYTLETWGSYVFVTQAGAQAAQFAGWVAFSPRWFDPATGYAPNGIHITDLAAQWQADGGQPIDPKLIAAFPPKSPTPVPPTPPAPPTPAPPPGPGSTVKITLTPHQIQEVVNESGALTVTPDMTIQQLLDALEAALKKTNEKMKAGPPPATPPKPGARVIEERIPAKTAAEPAYRFDDALCQDFGPAPTVTVYYLPAPTFTPPPGYYAPLLALPPPTTTDVYYVPIARPAAPVTYAAPAYYAPPPTYRTAAPSYYTPAPVFQSAPAYYTAPPAYGCGAAACPTCRPASSFAAPSFGGYTGGYGYGAPASGGCASGNCSRR